MPSSSNGKNLVIGVGGAGCSLAVRMSRQHAHADYLAINTDAAALDKMGQIPTLLIGGPVTHGRSARRSMDLGRSAACASMNELVAACHGYGRVILLAGLAGGTGSGSTLELASELQKQGFDVGVVGVRPFDFEGAGARHNAEQVLEQLAIMGIPNFVLDLKDVIDLMGPTGNLFESMVSLEERVVEKAIELMGNDRVTAPEELVQRMPTSTSNL